MYPVIFDIPVIINDINAAGNQAETNKPSQQLQQNLRVEELPCKKNRNKKEKILCPVFGPDQFDIMFHTLQEVNVFCFPAAFVISCSTSHKSIGSIIMTNGTINSLV